MTVIVGYYDQFGRATLVADRVWYGYGSSLALACKIHVLQDAIYACAGDSRSVAMMRATSFEELCEALVAQGSAAGVDALIVHRNTIFVFHGVDGGPNQVREVGYKSHRIIGSYHNPVSKAIELDGLNPYDAVTRVHTLWGLDVLPDIADESWCEEWNGPASIHGCERIATRRNQRDVT